MISPFNVLKKYAGKEEISPDVRTTEEQPILEKAAPAVPAFSTVVYLFKADDPIAYSNLLEECKKNPNLIEKLKTSKSGGVSGISGDNIKWERIIVKTNEIFPARDDSYIIYTVSIGADFKPSSDKQLIAVEGGKKLPITTNYKGKNIEDIANDIESKYFVNGILSFDNDTIFAKIGDTFNLNKAIEGVSSDNLNLVSTYRYKGVPSFNNTFGASSYRIAGKGALLSPTEFKEIKEDNFMGEPGVPFKGLVKQIKDIELTIGKTIPKKRTPTEPPTQRENTAPDIAAAKGLSDVGTKEKAEGRFMTKSARDYLDSSIKLVKEDERGIPTYTGDTSIMQDLVRLQHKKMKIRKEASVIKKQTTGQGQILRDTGKTPKNTQPAELEKSQGVIQKVQEQMSDVANNMKSLGKRLSEQEKKDITTQQKTTRINPVTPQKSTPLVQQLGRTQKLLQQAMKRFAIEQTVDPEDTSKQLEETSKQLADTSKQLGEVGSTLEGVKRSTRQYETRREQSIGDTYKPYRKPDPKQYYEDANPPGSMIVNASSVIEKFLNQ